MERILIVDDDASIVTLLVKLLTEEGYTVSSAGDGVEACEILSREAFDLLLIDIKMPKMDGIELLKVVKKQYPQSEVIIVTGFATAENAVETLRSGAYDYVIKPFNVKELKIVVRNCLDHGRLLRQEKIFRETTNLYQLAQELSKSQSERNLLQSILDCTAKTLHADGGSVFLYIPEKDELMPMASLGHQQQNKIEEIKSGERIVGWVAQKKQPILLQGGVAQQPQFKDLPNRHEICSSMIAPLIYQDKLIGVICINRFVDMSNYQFTQHDLDSLQFFALHATLILNTMRQQQAMKQLDDLKSEFVANVSHELRTPLMAISGAIDLLASPASTAGMSERSKMFMELITRNSVRMCHLVNELLDFSRIETRQLKLHITQFDIKKLTEESLMDFDLRAKEKKITLTGEYETGDFSITADRERMKQVITNLINNAVKFTPENGSIKVKLHFPDKDSISVTVEDTGIGIPNDKLDKVFQKFYQIDGTIAKPQAGFGLGLAIVKTIVEAHAGSIRVESEIEKGTKFHVVVPRRGPVISPVTTN